VIDISKDKYLRKNEFRYNTNPEVKNPRGEGHIGYVTVRHKKHSKINVVTHAQNFYGESTYPLKKNPNVSKPSNRISRVSVPVWEKNSYLKDKPQGDWKMSKEDRKTIRKINKKYANKDKK